MKKTAKGSVRSCFQLFLEDGLFKRRLINEGVDFSYAQFALRNFIGHPDFTNEQVEAKKEEFLRVLDNELKDATNVLSFDENDDE